MSAWDVGTWVGVISFVLAIPMGVLSIFFYGWLRADLEKRKLVKTDQTRLLAIQAYNRVKAFHNRTRDRYSYYLILVGWSAICAVVSGTNTVLLFVLHPDIQFNFQPDPQLHPGLGIVILLALAIAFALFAVMFMVILYDVSRHLENFDAYKRELEDRWGPIDIDDISAHKKP
jgi:hypothetical protein